MVSVSRSFPNAIATVAPDLQAGAPHAGTPNPMVDHAQLLASLRGVAAGGAGAVEIGPAEATMLLKILAAGTPPGNAPAAVRVDDVGPVIARAAELKERAERRSVELTPAQLREVGEQVGIEPHFIDAAAASIGDRTRGTVLLESEGGFRSFTSSILDFARESGVKVSVETKAYPLGWLRSPFLGIARMNVKVDGPADGVKKFLNEVSNYLAGSDFTQGVVRAKLEDY
jgi:hypothetical protein